jgi:hypothetical protein
MCVKLVNFENINQLLNQNCQLKCKRNDNNLLCVLNYICVESGLIRVEVGIE